MKSGEKLFFPRFKRLLLTKFPIKKILIVSPKVMPIRKHLGQIAIVPEYSMNTKRAFNPLKYKAFSECPEPELE